MCLHKKMGVILHVPYSVSTSLRLPSEFRLLCILEISSRQSLKHTMYHCYKKYQKFLYQGTSHTEILTIQSNAIKVDFKGLSHKILIDYNSPIMSLIEAHKPLLEISLTQDRYCTIKLGKPTTQIVMTTKLNIFMSSYLGRVTRLPRLPKTIQKVQRLMLEVILPGTHGIFLLIHVNIDWLKEIQSRYSQILLLVTNQKIKMSNNEKTYLENILP